jgi:hypothetical protein
MSLRTGFSDVIFARKFAHIMLPPERFPVGRLLSVLRRILLGWSRRILLFRGRVFPLFGSGMKK